MPRMDKQKIKGTQGRKHNKENPRRGLEWIYKNKTETTVLVRRPIVRYALMPMGGWEGVHHSKLKAFDSNKGDTLRPRH